MAPKPKVKLIEDKRTTDGKRFFVFDAPGVVVDWENWGFEPNTANFLAWCLKNRDVIEDELMKPKNTI